MDKAAGQSKGGRAWIAVGVVSVAAIAGGVWALGSPSQPPGPAPSATDSAPSSSNTFVPPEWLSASAPIASVSTDPAQPSSTSIAVAPNGPCPSGFLSFDGTTPKGKATGCQRIDPATGQGIRDGDWSIVENTGNTLRGNYVDGKRDGDWMLWSPGGKAVKRWQYKNDAYDGWETEWNEFGQKVIDRHYSEGVLDGDTIYVLPDGTQVHEVWRRGRLVSTTDPTKQSEILPP